MLHVEKGVEFINATSVLLLSAGTVIYHAIKLNPSK